MSNNANMPFAVYDIGGRIVASGKTSSGETNISIPNTGVYIVKAGTTVVKIRKQ